MSSGAARLPSELYFFFGEIAALHMEIGFRNAPAMGKITK